MRKLNWKTLKDVPNVTMVKSCDLNWYLCDLEKKNKNTTHNILVESSGCQERRSIEVKGSSSTKLSFPLLFVNMGSLSL